MVLYNTIYKWHKLTYDHAMAAERIHIPIDRAGRVVLPKEMRDRLGLQPGVEFEVIEEANRIILSPVPKEPRLTKKRGVLVVVPDEMPAGADPATMLKKQREDRGKQLW